MIKKVKVSEMVYGQFEKQKKFFCNDFVRHRGNDYETRSERKK